MITVAKLRNARLSPQKGRLVCDQIRGKKIESALQILTFSNKKAAKILKKVLNSAIANAENNFGADIDELFVSTAYVDEAKMLKRIMPRAKGRAAPIQKRNSHILIEVSDGR